MIADHADRVAVRAVLLAGVIGGTVVPGVLFGLPTVIKLFPVGGGV